MWQLILKNSFHLTLSHAAGQVKNPLCFVRQAHQPSCTFTVIASQIPSVSRSILTVPLQTDRSDRRDRMLNDLFIQGTGETIYSSNGTSELERSWRSKVQKENGSKVERIRIIIIGDLSHARLF